MMRKRAISLLTLSLLLAAAPLSGQAADANVQALKDKAAALVENLANGRFLDATRGFDIDMKISLTPERLRAAWLGVAGQAGRYQELLRLEYRSLKGRDVVHAICRFQHDSLDIQLAFDGSKNISGLYFLPVASPGIRPSDKIAEDSVTVGSGQWALPGTLSLPKGSGPFPAVVLVHGSGPNDRDETLGPNKPFRDLAWGLAERGVAVLRYDKRTRARGREFVETYRDTFTVRQEVIDDALQAVALLRSNPQVDRARIFVLGHSLGGYLLPRIMAADSGIAGGIVLAGPSRPMEDLYLEQLRYIAGLGLPQSQAVKDQLETIERQVARVKGPDLSPATPAADLPMGLPPRYWLDLAGYDPAALAKTLGRRMMVLQGERDYQVTMADYAGWQKALAADKNATFKRYPQCNHLFMEGKGRSTPSEYEQQDCVSFDVIKDIAKWTKAR
jgi:hypothetical protein